MKIEENSCGCANKCLLIVSSLLVLYLPSTAMAGRPVLGAEISSGGDEIARLSNGDNVKAGELLYVGAGYDFTLNHEDTLHLRAMLGYKTVRLNADNGDIKFDRFPLDMVLIKSFDKFIVGAGLTYHLSPTYDGTINGSNTRIDFSNAVGTVLQAGYTVAQRVELGLRFTAIDYKSSESFVLPDGSVDNKLNGNSVGIYLAARL